ncbi:MAG TPA: hypothetical protein VGD01_01805 [Candidatus Elarobacter sp.]|jgi:hypothetical protein
MNFRVLAASAVLGLAASACGNAGSSAVPSHALSNPSPAPSPSAGSAASAKRSSMTISLTIPARHASSARRTRTVSPNLAYLDVVLQSLDGVAQPVNGPYSTLIPVSQLGACSGGGTRGKTRAPQTLSGCFSASVPAPVGDAVYAVGVLDAAMTLLDYADNAAVHVSGSGNDTLAASLNGVAASVIGSYTFTDPGTTADPVHCSPDTIQYDAHALCSYTFYLVDASDDNMGAGTANAHAANRVVFTATDVMAQALLSIAHDDFPSSAPVATEIDFDPAQPAASAPSGSVLQAGFMANYGTTIRPDLGAIPAGTTHVVEFKAAVDAAPTTAFGPSVVIPPARTFTWDLPCKTVTVAAGDPSGVAEGTALQFCDIPANLNLTIQ